MASTAVDLIREKGEPRAYGERVRRGVDEAMDGLSDAVSRTRTETYSQWEALYLKTVGISGSTEIKAERLREIFAISLEALRLGLPSAEPLYVAADACVMLDVAQGSLPTFRVEESDLLVRSGFAWFSQPYIGFHGEDDLVAVGWTKVPSGSQCHLAAFTRIAGNVVPYTVLPVPLGEIAQADTEWLTEAAGQWGKLTRLAITLWLLTGQRLLGANLQKPTRAARRRRIGEIESVIVVDLRRKSYPETDGSRSVEWSHRWLTRGHWRNQWFPSEQRHKPIWIASYVKGPPDKPFVAKRRAFEFVR